MGNPLERTDFFSLRLFLAIVERGSIAEAARHAFIAPTAVTKRVQELEHAFGTRLLVRGPKGVQPTDAGRALARHVRALEDLAGRMRAEMKDHAEGVRGHVRLIANASSLVEFLADEITAFAKEHPGIRVDLEEAHSDDVVRAVRDGNADLGVFAPPVSAAASVSCETFRTDRLALAVPSDHPLAARDRVGQGDLRELPLIGVHGASSLSSLVSQALGSQDRLRVSSNDVARWLVSRHLGVTILPDGLIRPYETALGIRAVSIDEPWANRSLQLCVRSEESLSGAARAMLGRLRSVRMPGAAPRRVDADTIKNRP